MVILSKLSERLKELMFYHENIKSEYLARDIGVTGATVRGWMNGTHEISLHHAILLADYFTCSLDYLAGRTEQSEKVLPRPLPPFYDNLRKVLKDTKVTRYRITKDTSIKDSFFTNWAKGEKPKLATVCVLADYLNVTLDYLVGRTDY